MCSGYRSRARWKALFIRRIDNDEESDGVASENAGYEETVSEDVSDEEDTSSDTSNEEDTSNQDESTYEEDEGE